MKQESFKGELFDMESVPRLVGVATGSQYP
jgi:hypothetical protein